MMGLDKCPWCGVADAFVAKFYAETEAMIAGDEHGE